MADWMESGEVANTHGIRGEIKVNPWCDSPEFLLGFSLLRIQDKEYAVKQSRVHKNQVLVALEGVDTVEAAQALRGRTVYIDREGVALPEGRYFVQDLEGLSVVEEDGRHVGTLVAVLHMPAQDVYQVRGEDGERLIPAVPEFIREIDTTAGIIRVRLIEGM